MPIARVVADANVLLSALVGKSALRVFTEFTIQVHATQFNAMKSRNTFPKWPKSTSCTLNWSVCNGSFFLCGCISRKVTRRTSPTRLLS
jgi:hypothetical protein